MYVCMYLRGFIHAHRPLGVVVYAREAPIKALL